MKTAHLKTMLVLGSVTIIFALIGCVSTPATFNNGAEYLNAISKKILKIQDDMWEYMRTFAHVKDKAQVEAKRQKVIATIEKAIAEIDKMEPYNGDIIYKNSVLEYLYIQSVIMKEDYAKIMDMESIAEQSYDAMEAYLLAKQTASKKMVDAGKALNEKEQIFAKNNQITLTEVSNETTKKLAKAGEVIDYYNEIYLIFFKSFKQELYIFEAITASDTDKIEQNRQTLIKYSDEGLKNINSIQPYDNDDSLVKACKKVLEFYKKEALEDIPIFPAGIEQRKAYEQLKKNFDAKKDSDKTQADVDKLNAKVDELNGTTKKYNETMQKLNNDRGKYHNSWNEAADKFIDTHVPR